MKICCYKLLCFRVICHTAVHSLYTILLLKSKETCHLHSITLSQSFDLTFILVSGVQSFISVVQAWLWSVQFSRSVVSDSLRPHEPQHAGPPCPSPTPGVHPNPCPWSWWYHPTISSSVISSLLLLPSIFPSIRVFSNESALHIRFPKYWSFSRWRW